MNDSPDLEAYRQLLAGRFLHLRTLTGFSQAEIAPRMNTTQNLVFRAEHDLRLGLEGFFKVLLYYVEEHGINPEWILVPDNRGVSLRRRDYRLDQSRLALLDSFLQSLSALPS